MGDSGTRFGLDIGAELAGALFDDGPWVLVGLAVLVLAVLAIPFLLFAFALALEVLLVLALAVGVLAGRILLRRPFAVVAVAAEAGDGSGRSVGLAPPAHGHRAQPTTSGWAPSPSRRPDAHGGSPGSAGHRPHRDNVWHHEAGIHGETQ